MRATHANLAKVLLEFLGLIVLDLTLQLLEAVLPVLLLHGLLQEALLVNLLILQEC